MPDVDNSIALGVKPAGADLSTPLMTLAQLQMLGARGQYLGAMGRYQNLRVNALQALSENPTDPSAFNQLAAIDPDTAKNYQAVSQTQRQIGAQNAFGSAVNNGDPNAINRLAAFPDAYKTAADAIGKLGENQRAQVAQRMDMVGRAAMSVASLPQGPEREKEWDKQLDGLLKGGAIDQPTHDRLYGNPSDMVLHTAIAQSMGVKDFMEANGETAGAKARATLPAELTKIGAEGAQSRQTERSKPIVTNPGQGITDPVALGVPGASSGVAGAPGNVGGPGAVIKPALSPQQMKEQEGAGEALGKVSSDIISNETKAPKILQDVQILRRASADAFRPGARGEERAALARNLVDMIQSTGNKPPDVVTQAAKGADVIDKVGGQMTTDIVRSLGTREALGIYQAVGRYMPNNKMSQGGFDAIVNSLEQGALRDQDIGNFRRQWLAPKSPANPDGGHSSVDGMMASFDQKFPKEVYASHVWPMPVPKSRDEAIKGAIYSNGKASMKWDGNQFVPVQ